MSTGWRAKLDGLLLSLERESLPVARGQVAAAIYQLALDVREPEWPELAAAVARLVGHDEVLVRLNGLALAALVLPKSEAVELLRGFVGHAAAPLREEAVARLADFVDPSLRGTLAVALNDVEVSVRFEAARGMALLHHASGVEVLTQALQLADYRFAAAEALQELGSADALPALRDAMKGWLLPAFDRTRIAGALASFGDEAGIAHLFKRAGKRWSVDRAMAVVLLGEVKAPGAKARLLELVHNKKDSCRGAAARALGALGDVSVLDALLSLLDEPGLTDDLRLDVAEGLLKLDRPQGVDRVRTLTFSDPESRAELAELLTAHAFTKGT